MDINSQFWDQVAERAHRSTIYKLNVGDVIYADSKIAKGYKIVTERTVADDGTVKLQLADVVESEIVDMDAVVVVTDQ